MQRAAGNRATARLLLGPHAHQPTSSARRPLALHGATAAALTAARYLQLKRFEFDSYQLDSDDLDGFRLWCEGMGRANPARLASMIAFLFANGPGIDGRELIRMIELAYAGAGNLIPARVTTIGGQYGAILTRLEELADGVGSVDRVRRTITAAALIDANAARIAAFRGHARYAVLQAVGEQPSTGFDNESAGAIQERARVLLAAWAGLSTQHAQLDFFNKGFGTDPCIAARLNGIAEYQARALGISEEALSGARYNGELGNRILGLAYEFLDPDEPDWAAFLEFLETDHTEIFTHPDFHATYPVAKSAYV